MKSGVDVAGYTHVCYQHELWHLISGHTVGYEIDPENVPVTDADLRQIPWIVANPDEVVPRRHAHKPDSLEYRRADPGGIFHYVEFILEKPRRLSLKTLWKRRG